MISHPMRTLNFRSPLLALLATVFVAAQAQAVTMDWRTVGNPGNAPDNSVVAMTDGTTGYGAVPYAYKIGTYDVTNNQYTEFLNAADRTGANALGLYYSGMTSDPVVGGISFNSLAADGSKYSVIANHGQQPATFVTWYSTLRFANWLNNGQGSANTETGAYTLGALGPGGIPINGDSITRNSGASVFLPSENEWYKAAYYDPTKSSYFHFPTSSNVLPDHVPPPGVSNSANYVPGGWPNPDYNLALGHLTDVGAYSSSPSPYGTFDQGGNVDQWTEQFKNLSNGPSRIVRGGAYTYVWDHMLSAYRGTATPKFGWYGSVGFRVAGSMAIVPEPSSLVLAAFGFAGLATWCWRRRIRK